MRTGFVLAVLLLPLVAGCAETTQPNGWAAIHHEALDELATHRTNGRFSTFLAPYAVEAAALGNVDPRSWPADGPAALGLAIPEGRYLSQLRPAFAFALTYDDLPTARAHVRSVVLAGLNGTQFGDAALLNDDAFALRALAAVGSDADGDGWSSAVASLARNQIGGWSYQVGGAPDSDSTGIILVALAEAGGLGLANRTAAITFLASAQDNGGGYGTGPGESANCDSTVWALRGLLALDEPTPDSAWSYLASLRVPGGWAYQAGGAANALCTAEVAALFGAAFAADVPVPPAISFE